jgi:hypothetical protein
MTLFAIIVLLSFALWLAAAIPGSRVPEWSARLGFLIAAILWFVARSSLA